MSGDLAISGIFLVDMDCIEQCTAILGCCRTFVNI